MATGVRHDSAELFFDHFATLRLYAEKVFLDGECLSPLEDGDRERRVAEYLSVGASCDFTERQLVALLFAQLF